MTEVTMRFKTDDATLVQNLVTAWLEDEGITIQSAGRQDTVDLTYVKERDRD